MHHTRELSFPTLTAAVALTAVAWLAGCGPLPEDEGLEKTETATASSTAALETFHASYRFFAVHSNLCVAVNAGGMDDNTIVRQYYCEDLPQQKFNLQPAGDGYYNLVATHSNKCLTVLDAGTGDGVAIRQWTCLGQDHQKFKPVSVGNGAYNLVAKHSGRCMDVTGVSTQPGAHLQQWGCGGGNNQKFRLEPTTTTGNVLYGRWTGSGGRDPSSPNNRSFTVTYTGPTTPVTFSLSASILTPIDTYLYLLDANGNVLGQDDNGGGNLDSRLSVTLSTGTYKLVAATAVAGKSGQFTVSSDKATLSYPQKLYVQQVDSFVWVYDDDGSGAADDVSVWRPNLSQYPGYYSLGDVAMPNHDSAPGSTFVVKGEGDLLAPPVDYTYVWNDRGSGGDHDGSFWAPVAPAGYTCLGHVANSNYNKPSTDLIRCIKSAYVLPAAADYVWSDSQSHADDNVTLYQAKPNDFRGLAVNTFVALPHYDGSGSASFYRVLNKSATANVELRGLPVNALTAAALAPRVWLDPDEDFFPSSTQFFLNQVHQSGGFLVTNEDLGCANCTDPAFLNGQQPNQAPVPVYAEIVNRTQDGQPTNITDIIYWMFYPYNNGKLVCMGLVVEGDCMGDYSRFGNHVGDWEHMTVRFYDGRPYQIYLAQHSHGDTLVYGDKNLRLSQGRPTVYAADGSHGLYADTGRHVYQSLPNYDVLVDYTDPGMLWDTGSTVIPFQWQSSGTYTGSLDWLNITSRWGNPKQECGIFEYVANECVLNDGPTAPMSKGFSQPSSLALE
jgi:hypothetical protein